MEEGIRTGDFVFPKGDMASLTEFLGFFDKPKASKDLHLIAR